MVLARMRQHGWLDGELAQALKEGRPPLNTSFPDDSDEGRRIDQVWMNAVAASAVVATRTGPVVYGPVHAIIEVEFDWAPVTRLVPRWRKPARRLIPQTLSFTNPWGKEVHTKWSIAGFIEASAQVEVPTPASIRASRAKDLMQDHRASLDA